MVRSPIPKIFLKGPPDIQLYTLYLIKGNLILFPAEITPVKIALQRRRIPDPVKGHGTQKELTSGQDKTDKSQRAQTRENGTFQQAQ